MLDQLKSQIERDKYKTRDQLGNALKDALTVGWLDSGTRGSDKPMNRKALLAMESILTKLPEDQHEVAFNMGKMSSYTVTQVCAPFQAIPKAINASDVPRLVALLEYNSFNDPEMTFLQAFKNYQTLFKIVAESTAPVPAPAAAPTSSARAGAGSSSTPRTSSSTFWGGQHHTQYGTCVISKSEADRPKHGL